MTESECLKLCSKLCDVKDISLPKLLGNGQKKKYIDIRHAFSIIAQKEGCTLEQIGEFLNRDHSTIIHYLNKRPENPDVKKLIDNNIALLRNLKNLLRDPSNERLRQKVKQQL